MNFSKLNFAILDQALISGSNFIISIFLAKVFTPEDYGLYIFGFTTLVFTIGLINNSICIPLTVLLPSFSSDASRSKYIFNSFLQFLLLSFLIIVFFYILFFLFSGGKFSDISNLFRVISYIIFFYLSHEFIRKLFLAHLKIKELFFVDLISYFTRILIIFLFFKYIDVYIIFYIYGLTSIFGIFCGLFLNKFYIYTNSFNWKYWQKNWNYGKWTLAEWIPFIISGQLYIYVVSFYLDNSANGIIGACRNFIAPLSMLLITIMNFSLPYYSKIFNQYGIDTLVIYLKKFLFLIIIFLSLYIIPLNFFSNKIMAIFFPNYLQFTYLILLFSIGILFNFLFKPFEIFFKVINYPKIVFFSRLTTAFITVLIIFPLINYFQITGAVISYIISQLLMFFSLTFLFVRFFNQQKRKT